MGNLEKCFGAKVSVSKTDADNNQQAYSSVRVPLGCHNVSSFKKLGLQMKKQHSEPPASPPETFPGNIEPFFSMITWYSAWKK